jgi:hypothetical protein
VGEISSLAVLKMRKKCCGKSFEEKFIKFSSQSDWLALYFGKYIIVG